MNSGTDRKTMRKTMRKDYMLLGHDRHKRGVLAMIKESWKRYFYGKVTL